MFAQGKGIVIGTASAMLFVYLSVNASGQISASRPATQPSKPAASADAIDIMAVKLLTLDAGHAAELVNSIYRAEAGEPRAAGPANGIGYLHSAHAETQTNTLVLVGDEKALSAMRGLVTRLDDTVEVDTTILTRQMNGHRAAGAAQLLNQIFNAEPATTQQAFTARRARAEGCYFHATADGERNLVFIVADSARAKIASEVLDKLEVNDGPGNPPFTNVYHLRSAKAAPAAAALNALFHVDHLPSFFGPEIGPEFHSWFFNAVAFEPTNSVLITGSTDAIYRATGTLDELDHASKPTTQPAGN